MIHKITGVVCPGASGGGVQSVPPKIVRGFSADDPRQMHVISVPDILTPTTTQDFMTGLSSRGSKSIGSNTGSLVHIPMATTSKQSTSENMTHESDTIIVINDDGRVEDYNESYHLKQPLIQPQGFQTSASCPSKATKGKNHRHNSSKTSGSSSSSITSSSSSDKSSTVHHESPQMSIPKESDDNQKSNNHDNNSCDIPLSEAIVVPSISTTRIPVAQSSSLPLSKTRVTCENNIIINTIDTDDDLMKILHDNSNNEDSNHNQQSTHHHHHQQESNQQQAGGGQGVLWNPYDPTSSMNFIGNPFIMPFASTWGSQPPARSSRTFRGYWTRGRSDSGGDRRGGGDSLRSSLSWGKIPIIIIDNNNIPHIHMKHHQPQGSKCSENHVRMY